MTALNPKLGAQLKYKLRRWLDKLLTRLLS